MYHFIDSVTRNSDSESEAGLRPPAGSIVFTLG